MSDPKLLRWMLALTCLMSAGSMIGLLAPVGEALPGEPVIFAVIGVVAAIGMAVAAIWYVRLERTLARRGVF